MPAQLLLVNPSKPRRRLRRSKPASPAQKAARARFAAMAKSGMWAPKKKKSPSSKKSSFYDTPFGKKILARKARKNPSRKMTAAEKRAVASLAADTGTVSRQETTVAKPKKKASKKAAPKKKTAPKKAPKKAASKPKKASKKASKKAAPKKAAKKASKKARASSGGKKGGKKRAKLSKNAAVRKLQIRRNRLRAAAKKAKGASRSILSLRARAAGLRARAATKARRNKKTKKWIGLSPAQRASLKASGLMKVNPSVMSIVKDMGVLLPQAGATIAGLALAAIAGAKTVEALRKAMPEQAADTKSLINSPHIPAVVAAGVGAVAYIAARMVGSKPGKVATIVNRVAPGLFIGGLAAAAVHTMAHMKVKGEGGVETSLGKRLGLPIGEYVIGEYVVGQGLARDVDGIAVDGMGSIFSHRSLGEYVPNEFDNDGPREAARGRRLEASAAGLLKAELAMHGGKVPVDGTLSGSIFDD